MEIKKENGFTLVEVMVAITLLSFLMVGVYTVIENSTETKDKIVAEDREMMGVQAALNRFGLDFGQIFSPAYFAYEKKLDDERDPDDPVAKPTFTFTASDQFSSVTYQGDPIPAVKSDRNTIEFFTSSNRRKVQDVRHSRFAWVRYQIKNSEKQEEEINKDAPLVLVRQMLPENPFAGELDWNSAKEYTLLRNIKKFEFQYWNAATRKFESSVDALGPRKYALRGVKIILTWVDQNKSEFEITRTYRPLWPEFDTKADYLERKKAEKEEKKDEKGGENEDA